MGIDVSFYEEPSVLKISSNLNNRSALFDITCMSVYFFEGNRRVIATNNMRSQTIQSTIDLCKVWVKQGQYNELDFAK